MSNYNQMFNTKDALDAPPENPIYKTTSETVDPLTTAKQKPKPLAVVTNCNLLNVRKKPSKDSEVIKVINKGNKVLPIKMTDEDWAYIQMRDRTCGYVMRAFIEEV